MQKTLDEKIARILEDPSCSDFILADAKDADMAFGVSAPGRVSEQDSKEKRLRTLDEYRQAIREVTSQGLVDVMLMSVSTSDLLTIDERLFDNCPVTPAIRANDTTDVWLAGGVGSYGSQPSLPFRTATIDHAMCGQEGCLPEERSRGANLGLYSVTFNNDASLDQATSAAYREFRLEAEEKGFRHFLEVFPPNAPEGFAPEDVPRFVNDMVARTLAGVPKQSRPLFLKIPYFGPKAMEELVAYDSSLIVGILGGSTGTTLDAFHMLWEAKQHGARAALYGRKINHAEHQLSFIQQLRAIADGQIKPIEAVHEYHASLQKLGIPPTRTLDNDLRQTCPTTNYSN